jgi:hypothetical protein
MKKSMEAMGRFNEDLVSAGIMQGRGLCLFALAGIVGLRIGTTNGFLGNRHHPAIVFTAGISGSCCPCDPSVGCAD